MAVGFLQLQHTKQHHDHDKTGDTEMKQTHNGLLVSTRVVAHLYHITQEIYRPLIDRQGKCKRLNQRSLGDKQIATLKPSGYARGEQAHKTQIGQFAIAHPRSPRSCQPLTGLSGL